MVTKQIGHLCMFLSCNCKILIYLILLLCDWNERERRHQTQPGLSLELIKLPVLKNPRVNDSNLYDRIDKMYRKVIQIFGDLS